MPPKMTVTFRTKAYNQGQTIFKEGQDGSFACIINTGKVAVTKEVNGEQVPLAVLGRGSIFGEMALVSNDKRTASVTALEYTEVVVVDRQRLQKALETANPMVQALVYSLVERLTNTNQLVAKQQQHSDMVKALANLIQLWTEGVSPDEYGRIQLPISKLADYSKATMQMPAPTLEQVLDYLAQDELLNLRRTPRGRMVVVDKPSQLVRKATNLAKRMAEAEQMEAPAVTVEGEEESEDQPYIDLFELAQLLDETPQALCQMLAEGKMPETLVMLPREAALKWAAQYKPQPPGAAEQESVLSGLLEADPPVLQRALQALGLANITILLAGASPAARRIILDNYAPTMREELEAQMQQIPPPEAGQFKSAVKLLAKQIERFLGSG